ncbi:MAG: LysM peptidoglycan-binding domain-containing protein [Terrimonas sp.]|nr:LysM peptidoglycan-binding domain-containing protein [Terrimonas sp.]
MKKVFLIAFILMGWVVLRAQHNELYIKSGSKGIFIEHTVVAKEGLFAIGRLYNVHPNHLAAFNHLDINKGLAIGQIIQVPLTDTNFSQQTSQGVPVYYAVKEGEGLYRVSLNANKVPFEKIKDWNGLKNDNIEVGQHLVVGYLQTKDMKPGIVKRPEIKEEVPPPPPVIADTKSEPKIEKQPAVEKDRNEAVTAKNIDDEKTLAQPAVNASQRVSTLGYFKVFFDQQVKRKPVSKEETFTSGIFKTLSGWQDGKYYLLIDNVLPGTIVRVMNPQNGKMVYAKVLGEMAGMKINEGLGMRISNAAASVLEIPEAESEKFIVRVSY